MDSGTFVLDPAAVGGAPSRACAIIAARGHSRRVWAMRRLLEIVVVGGVVALGLVAVFRNFGGVLRDVSFEGVGIEGGRITMDKPHLSGARPGGGGYNITAVKAMQDALHPGDVDLALIGGEVTTPDREVSRLSADSGRYESANETLALQGDVRLSNTRYEIYLQSVHIAFKKGEYVSSEPVKVLILPQTTITADSIAIRDGGSEATFTGHVHTLVNAKGEDAGP